LAERRAIEQDRRVELEREQARQEKERITFGHYSENTYFPVVKLTKKPASYHTESIYYHKWIEPVIGHLFFKDISPLMIEKIKREMLHDGKSPRTVQYVLAINRQIWNMALRDNLISGDSPTKKVSTPRISNKRLRFLTLEEANILLSHIRDRSELVYQICIISLHCGLRAGEIFNLKWKHIDIDRGIITVDGKGDKTRHVYMTDAVKNMLIQIGKKEPEELVFQSTKGEKILRVSNVFQRSVEDCGLNKGITDSRQKIVFHTLRHTFASWLVQNGTDLYVVQKLMGHATFDMTQRYAHLAQSQFKDAVKNLDKMISSVDNVWRWTRSVGQKNGSVKL
jgi:integrase